MVHRSASTAGRTLAGLSLFCYHIVAGFLPQFAGDMSMFVAFLFPFCRRFHRSLAYYMTVIFTIFLAVFCLLCMPTL